MSNYAYSSPRTPGPGNMSDEELDKYIRRQRLLAEAEELEADRKKKEAQKNYAASLVYQAKPAARMNTSGARQEDPEKTYEERLREAKAKQGLESLQEGRRMLGLSPL